MTTPTCAVLSCCAEKLPVAAPAHALYRGPLFRKSLACLQNNCIPLARTFILSARHGLIPADEILEPYNVSLPSMTAAERRVWCAYVATQLPQLPAGPVLVLAGKLYREALLPRAADLVVPLAGLGIGEQLHALTVGVTLAA